jgi:hypothetical protein
MHRLPGLPAGRLHRGLPSAAQPCRVERSRCPPAQQRPRRPAWAQRWARLPSAAHAAANALALALTPPHPLPTCRCNLYFNADDPAPLVPGGVPCMRLQVRRRPCRASLHPPTLPLSLF